ncbi:mechanosensitive ion channel family protein [Mesorhizobium captivum]|uniref:mechanosensitive ion channel family protein n=1 Tax=Mesorhizobium captivum TaxID=3072319 RepID=UPI002A248FBD|nr:mechanosensitive ion channel family protein [Mesorhizobium sp. VK3C]MDX8448220.1 mechanosensitive ion channel family protein [Mesorhizobium sp. VK3C]
MKPRDKKQENLSRLERAAQQSADPNTIQQQAKKPEEKIPVSPRKESLRWTVGFAAAALLLFAIQVLINWHSEWLDTPLRVRVLNYVWGGFLVFVMLSVANIIEVFLIGRIPNRVSRFNLKRIFRLIVVVAIVFVAISVLFVNWYAAVVSLGLISLILGFALQMPISSFIAWIYILARAPYRVGDRIRIGNAHGDVIDVSYLDTTLWEFGGEHLWTDHPSGRVIKFPNSTVFNTPVFNYSWPLFPYVWNEIKFQLAYESDLEFVAKTMIEVVDEQIGDIMTQKVKIYKHILAETPVDELEVKEHPVVHFRVSENTWLEAIVRYLVPPKQAGRTKTRLIKEMLARMNAEPDRVLFPKSNSR